MKEKYLPIGSIVTLTGKNQKLMIIGYYSIKYNNVVKMYDYMGCIYPEGLLDVSKICSFNHSDIANVIFEGYNDDSYDIINNNMINQLSVEDETKFMQNANMSNIKYNDNGVVIYDELPELKIDPKINEMLNSIEVRNPFMNENIVNPIVDKSIDIISENPHDAQLIDIPEVLNTDSSEHIPHYKFDENGIIIED